MDLIKRKLHNRRMILYLHLFIVLYLLICSRYIHFGTPIIGKYLMEILDIFRMLELAIAFSMIIFPLFPVYSYTQGFEQFTSRTFFIHLLLSFVQFIVCMTLFI